MNALNHSHAISAMLIFIGIVAMPKGESPWFYASASIAAVVVVAMAWLAFKFVWFRYAIGYTVVCTLLAMAIFIVANLPPYVPGVSQ